MNAVIQIMPKPADVSTKKLISLAPDNWVKWVTQLPNIEVKEILNSHSHT